MGKANSKTELREGNETIKAGTVTGRRPDMEAELPFALGKKTCNIAIVGQTGAGKSSLVNALREFETDEGVGAAATDVIQGTMAPAAYVYPMHPEVTLWDLPGIGTNEFKGKDYVEDMGLDQYDFFIIVAEDRFTQYDAWLVRAIQKINKRFYYVRTKMDDSTANACRGSGASEEETLETIRANCCENLRKAGETSPRVFLVSRWHWDKYDFRQLQQSLWEAAKKHASASPTGKKQKGFIRRMFLNISKKTLKMDLEKLKAALEGKADFELAAEIREELGRLQNARLDIAVTGRSGAGKSSLVNALRGMTDSEEGSAKTGEIQTTMEAKGYPHPTLPQVTVWDLPGIGTPEFTSEKYLKQVNFSRYDFFLIVASGRFTEHDAKLAREIQKMKKRFYYVRTKTDVNIENESRKRNFNESETLEKIRNYSRENLATAGQTSPHVFLISRWDLSLYDFPLFFQTLQNDLDGLKRHALILASPVFSKEVMERKKAELESLIWKLAFVSLFFGAVPVPGLSFACDVAILVCTLALFCKVFGLDEGSLRSLANHVGKPVEELKSAIKNTPAVAAINKELVLGLLAKSAVCLTLSAIELACDFVPVLGSVVGGTLSFFTTLFILRGFLQDVMTDARNVWAVVKRS